MRVKRDVKVTIEMSEMEAEFMFAILNETDPKGEANLEDVINTMMNAFRSTGIQLENSEHIDHV